MSSAMDADSKGEPLGRESSSMKIEWSRRVGFLAVVVSLLTGCNQLLGIHDLVDDGDGGAVSESDDSSRRGQAALDPRGLADSGSAEDAGGAACVEGAAQWRLTVPG